MPNTLNYTFLQSASGKFTSDVFDNYHYSLAVLQVTGSFTGAVIVVEGRVQVSDGPWVALGAWDTRDFTTEINEITSSGIYEVPIDGVTQLRLRIASLAGGSVTVSGVLYDSLDNSTLPDGSSSIRFGDPDLFVKGVAEQIYMDPSTGNIIGYDRTAASSAVQMSVNFAQITGGMGNRLIGVLPDTVRVSGTYTSEAFSLRTREMIMGGQLAYNAVVPVCERILADSNTLIVSKKPAPFYGEDSIPDTVIEHLEYDQLSNVSVASFTSPRPDPLQSLVVGIEPVQAGSGDPSPDNVRPISGWTGAKVTRCGKNLWKFYSTGYVASDGTIGEAANNGRSDFFKIEPNSTYTFGTVNGSTLANVGLMFYDNNKRAILPRKQSTTGIVTATAPANARWACASFAKQSGIASAQDAIDYQIQFEPGTTATAYEPYSGETYFIAFPSEAGTVYGGTLDVTNGVLTVDRAMVVCDGSSDEYWVKHGSGSAAAYTMRCNILNFKFINGVVTAWANYLPSIDNGKTWNNYDNFLSMHSAGICTGIRSITTVSDWIAYLSENPLQVCYELATPLTYHLTPQEVDTLLGVNNVWADTGKIQNIEYLSKVTEETIEAQNIYRAYVRESDGNAQRGNAYGVDSRNGQILNFHADIGKTYEVTYYTHSISAQMLPAPSHWNPIVMTVQTRYAVYGKQGKNEKRGVLRGWLYFIVPRAILNANAGLTASQTATDETDGSWIALTNKRENMPYCDCSGDVSPIAYYVYVPCGDETQKVADIIISGGGLALAVGKSEKIPVKLVMDDDTLVQPDFSRLNYSSENESIATIDSDGMVTGVSAGTTRVHAYIARANGASLDASCPVTVTGNRSAIRANPDNVTII